MAIQAVGEFISLNKKHILTTHFNFNTINQLHTVSRIQQDRQREPSIKTLRSLLSAEFWRYCFNTIMIRIMLPKLNRKYKNWRYYLRIETSL